LFNLKVRVIIGRKMDTKIMRPPTVSQNKNTIQPHFQLQSDSSQSKVSWAKVAKGIALIGGLIVAGYSLYVLEGRLSAPPPPPTSPTPPPTPPSPQPICNPCNPNLNPFISNFCLLQDSSPTPSSSTGQILTQPSPPPPTSVGISIVDCFSSSKAAISFLTGKICCAGDLDCKDSGQGKFQSVHGDSWEGNFVNGLSQGDGIFTKLDGSTCDQQHDKGHLIIEVCESDDI
jgi:hypothetical protein